MSLAERLEAERPVRKTNFQTWVDELPKADREALLEAARDPAWTRAALHRIIVSEGVSVSRETIGDWRRRVIG